MRNKKRDTDKIVIQKMFDYCISVENIISRFGNTFEDYNSDFTFQMACSACIIQIGELTTRLTEDFKTQHSEIAWNQIKALRNLHVHEYEKVNYEYMWQILTEDIPELKKSLQAILEVI